MRSILASTSSCSTKSPCSAEALPALHGRNKLCLPLQINTKNLRSQSIRVSSFPRGDGLEFCFQFGSKRHFHVASLGSTHRCVNATRPLNVV
jgi:hypothetical protein